MLINQVIFAVHCLDPDLHIALEEMSQQLLGVTGEKMDSFCRGQRTHNATDGDVVVLALDDDLREPDLVPRAANELTYELIFRGNVHGVATRVV